MSENVVTLSKNTTVGLSIGLLLSIVIGVGAFVKSDTNLKRDLSDLKHTQATILAQNEALRVSVAELRDQIDTLAEDRWTRSDMRQYVRSLREKNPDLVLPFVD